MPSLLFRARLERDCLLRLTEEEGFLVSLERIDEKRPTPSNEPGAGAGVGRNPTPPSPLLLKAKAEILEYLAGERQSFDLPLRPQVTPFQGEALQALCKVAYGERISYQELAERLGSAKKARAIGVAMMKNPLPILIPCHRVVQKGRTLARKFSFGDLATQAFLLELEKET